MLNEFTTHVLVRKLVNYGTFTVQFFVKIVESGSDWPKSWTRYTLSEIIESD